MTRSHRIGLWTLAATLALHAPLLGSDASNAHAKRNKRGKKKKKKGEEEDEPPLTSYQVELEIQKREKQIEIDRKRGIKLLEEFIQKHQTNRAMPEALYRLAALYWERSQQKFLSDMKAWANRVDECKADPEGCPQGPPPEPNLDLSASQTIYVRLIRDYPRFRKLDTVRYLYGFSLRDQGKSDEAQQQFWAIINKHPNSTFVPDAWLAIGDHRFYADNDWNGALQAYSHVLEHPQSDSYAMALFKTAWCNWKLGDTNAAVRRFKEVLDEGDRAADDEGRKRLADLREEALEYLVQILSEDETNTPKDIYDFLASIDGTQYSRKILIRLAEAYEAQTRYDKSVPTYRFLIDLDKSHAEAAEFQVHVVTGVRGDGKPAKALDELRVLHDSYGPGTPWAKAHPSETKEAVADGEQILFDLGRSIHEGAQAHEKDTKAPDKDKYGLAARAYEDYMARFPANKNAVKVSYLAGDIYYFKLARLEKAGDAYLRVGESAPVGPLHRDALLAAINAYEGAMAQQPEPEPEPEPAGDDDKGATKGATKGAGATKKDDPQTAADDGEDPEKTDGEPADSDEDTPESSEDEGKDERGYNRIERKFIRAVDLFATLFPEDEEIGAILYKLGEFFYGRGDYDRAVQRFGRVAVDYPNSANAGAAGDRILESLNKAEDYDNIELWANKLKGAPAFADSTEQRRLDRIIVDSLLKQGETLADRGYYERAAGYYLRMAKEYPKHDKAPVALSNAGASLERARKAQAATAVYERLSEDYPRSKEAAQATLVVARVYENMGDYERAAVRYDTLAEKYPQHPNHADAMYNAGLLYQALGNDRKAVDRYQRYAKRYSGREDAEEVELRAGEVQAHAGNHKAAVKTLQRFVRRHPNSKYSVEANKLLGKSLIETGRLKDADKALSRAVKTAREAEGEIRVHGAEARYLQGELIYRRFEQAELDQRPAKLGASLDAKAKLLAEAKTAYLDVLTLKTAEWSTAALYRIGESYEKFAKSLRDYPVPKKLSQAQQDAYMEQLDTFALAFEEEAIGAYKNGYEKAVELGIYNSYTRRIRQALGRLSPQEYPPIHEVGAELRVAEGTGGGGRPLRSLRR